MIGLGNLLVFGLAGWISGGGGTTTGTPYPLVYGLINGLAFAPAAAVSFALGTHKQPSHAQLRFRGAARSYLRQLITGALIGAAFAVAVGLGPGATLLSGLAFGLALGSYVWLQRPTLITAAPSPPQTLHRDRTAALILGLAVTLAAGTTGGLTVGYAGDPALAIPSTPAKIAVAALMALAAGALVGGLSYGRIGAICYAPTLTIAGALANGPADVTGLGHGLSYAITFGFGLASVTMLPTAWGTYAVNRTRLALQGHLPWRLTAFLADAHHRGVLRQSGGTYQFRHTQLQHHLSHHS